MRLAPLLALPLTFALIGACHGAPEERVAARDAAPSAIETPFFATSSSPAADAGSPDGGRPDLRVFCDDVYAADAARLARRCQPKDQGLQRGLARAASQLCSDDLNAAVSHGRTSFDHDAAKHCIEMLQRTDVPRMSDTDTLFMHFPCDRVVLGTQDEGKACRWSVECKDGLACVGYAIGVDGTCKRPPKVGEACTSQRFGSVLNEQAAEMHHLSCGAGGWCDGKACEPLVAPGKACVNAASCDKGLSCVMGKCAKPGGSGAACFRSTDCAFGSWCNKTPSGAGTCEAKRPEGAECPLPDACRGRCDTPRAEDGGPAGVGRCAAVCGSG